MKMKYWLLCSCFATTVNALAEEVKITSASPTTATPEATKPASPPATPVSPAPSANDAGTKLHEGNCVRCHQPEIYTRDTRKMKSYEGVKTQVQWCATQLSIPWFEEEVEQVASYINGEYYKFETAATKK
jgi:mono/diheme cytochrome c family protein